MKKEHKENFIRALAESNEEERKRIHFFHDIYEIMDEEHEYRCCCEEMSELTQALLKYMRKDLHLFPEGRKKLAECREKIIDEIADVYNTLDSLKIMFGKDEVNAAIDRKINKYIAILPEIKEGKSKQLKGAQ